MLHYQEMRKAARKTTNIDTMEQNLAATVAKRQFIAATSNMGWRLAVTVIVPIVGGVKLDDYFNTTPSFTLLGLMLATVAGCAAVWATVKEVNREQAENVVVKTKRRVKRV